MVRSEGVRSKASRYKRFVLHRPDSRRLNETFVIPRPKSGLKEYLTSCRPRPPPPPPATGLGEGRVRSSLVSPVDLCTTRARRRGADQEGLPQWLGEELLG